MDSRWPVESFESWTLGVPATKLKDPEILTVVSAKSVALGAMVASTRIIDSNGHRHKRRGKPEIKLRL